MTSPKPSPRAGGLQPPSDAHSSSSASEVLQPTAGDYKSPAHSPCPQSVFFNKDAPVKRYRNWLPHWRQPGKWYFVTFRLADSLAQPRLKQWAEEREIWLKFHPPPWSDKTEQEYHRRFTAQFESWLDAGEGECVLRYPEAHEAVTVALRFFAAQPTDGDCKSPALDACAGGLQQPSAASSTSSASDVLKPTDGDFKSPARDVRYELGDFVVMPNHVHVLLRPLDDWKLERLLQSWKTFTAKAVNRQLGRTGTLWWKDNFDHLVRSAEKFAKFQRYIADNPAKAHLKPGEYHLHRTSLCYLNTEP